MNHQGPLCWVHEDFDIQKGYNSPKWTSYMKINKQTSPDLLRLRSVLVLQLFTTPSLWGHDLNASVKLLGIDFLWSDQSIVLALFPPPFSCSHFVSGNSEPEAGHCGLGDVQGTHVEGANDF